MDHWLLALTLLSVAAMLSCFRFAGCVLPTYHSAPETPDYGDTVKGETSLLAYWRLGEPPRTGPGGTAADEKGGNPGTYLLADLMAGTQSSETAHPPILQTGQPGLVVTTLPRTSVRVNGGYVSVPYSAVLNPPADKQFSVEAWVHPEWSPGETDLFRCVVASREDTGANKYGYILYAGPVLDLATFATTDPTMHWQAWVGDGTTWQMLVGPPVAVGQATYLLLTYDGFSQTLTLDAIDANTDMSTYARWVGTGTIYGQNPPAAAKPLYIGMGATEILPPGQPMYPFLGSLQEVAFYDKALTPSQVSDHVTAAGTL